MSFVYTVRLTKYTNTVTITQLECHAKTQSHCTLLHTENRLLSPFDEKFGSIAKLRIPRSPADSVWDVRDMKDDTDIGV